MSTPSDQVYRRVGRGGAGNWYSKKDVEEAEKLQAAADLEAQKHAATPAAVAAAAAAESAPAYTRAGRGGAGNFKDAATAAASVQLEREEVLRAQASSTAKPRTAGLSGRGGAGNWNDTTALGGAQQERDQRKVEDLELKVLQDVDAVLAAPAPAYKQAEKERDLEA
ncbi:hypothetical protein B0H67DRAFT_646496 [Lasiosphaeris hirsuta]|uniref:Uncharacterized protein n=1 Tax=Lasiosphaeris hirsuta TaxID=260670 RepID=A0AA40A8H3_9PEZI|nr:hypothetical protein B0H67DRAFT_646496 [Lasiosphaeris hirsuta]